MSSVVKWWVIAVLLMAVVSIGLVSLQPIFPLWVLLIIGFLVGLLISQVTYAGRHK